MENKIEITEEQASALTPEQAFAIPDEVIKYLPLPTKIKIWNLRKPLKDAAEAANKPAEPAKKELTARNYTIEGNEVTINGSKSSNGCTPKQVEYIRNLGGVINNNGGRNRIYNNISSIDASFAIQHLKSGKSVTINVN